MPEEELLRPTLVDRFKTFVASRRGKAIMVVTLFVLVFGAAGLAAYTRYFSPESSAGGASSLLPSFTLSDGPAQKPGVLTGAPTDEKLANRRPLAVMIENHPDARPQSGLVHADIVWEAIVEGGITRFMAIFSSEDVDKIGPVRSARPYFIHYAAGFNALYAHAGGSQAGLALIPETKQIVALPHAAAYFHREAQDGLASEHTLYTSTKDLYAYATEKKASTDAKIDGFKFADDAKSADRPSLANLSINFSSDTYKVDWTYDPTSNSYKRSLVGKPHVDRVSGDQFTVKNVAVIEVERRYDANTNQGKGEWFMTTEGSGPAKLFQNGTMIEGTWKKAGIGDMLKLSDKNGKELS